MRSEKSDDRCQTTEVRRQKSDDRCFCFENGGANNVVLSLFLPLFSIIIYIPHFLKVSVKDFIQLLIFSSIGGFILWRLWQSQQAKYLEQCNELGIGGEGCNLLDKLITDFQSCNFIWVILVCVVFILSNVCRALRWNQMLEPIGIRPKFYNSFFTVMVGYLANLGFPRFGEFVRGGLLAKYERQPFDKIFGTIIMDRTLDVLSLLLMLALGFLLRFEVLWNFVQQQLPEHGEKLILYGSIAGLLGMVGIVGLYFLFRQSSNIQNPLISNIRSRLLGIWNGVKSVKGVKNIPLFIMYSIGIWLSYFLMNYWMFFAFAPTQHLGPMDGLLVFDFGALGMVFPSPGGMGTYHAMIMESLSIVGVDKIDGFSFAMILFFSVNMLCNVGFGLMGLILLPLLNATSEDA